MGDPSQIAALTLNSTVFLTLNLVSKVILAIKNLCPQAIIVSNMNIFRQKRERSRHLKPNSLTSYIFHLDF